MTINKKKSAMTLAEKQQQAQQAAVIHGGAGAERRLSTGQEFKGLAAETEKQVSSELEIDGLVSIVRRDAIRLQTVADLYYQAILGAENLERLDSLVSRYGWIAASALRAWQSLRQLEKQRTDKDITEILRGGNEHD